LDQDTVRLAPQKVLNTKGVSFEMAANGSLQANVAPDAKQPQANIVWELQNRIYPYTIVNATVSAQSQLGGESKPVVLSRQRITQLSPQQGQPLQSVLQLPLAKLPGTWSWAALRAAGSAYVLPGRIELQLDEQKLSLSPEFKQRMESLFPGDPLQDIFTPPAEIHQSKVILPLQVRVEYGVAPLIAALALAASLLAATLWSYYNLTQLRRITYTLDGRPASLQGSIGRSYPIMDLQGQTVAQVKFGWFGQQLVHVKDGVLIQLG
jgi:hypothetical protein